MHKHHLHQIITSYCTTSHHTSFCIDKSSGKEGKLLLQIYMPIHEVKNTFGKESRKNVPITQDMPLAEVFLYRECTFVNGILIQQPRRHIQCCLGKEGEFLSLFMKRETVCMKISCITKNILHKKISKYLINVSYKNKTTYKDSKLPIDKL